MDFPSAVRHLVFCGPQSHFYVKHICYKNYKIILKVSSTAYCLFLQVRPLFQPTVTVVVLFQKGWTSMSRISGESLLDATYMQDAFIFSKAPSPWCRVHTVSYPVGSVSSSPGVKRPECETDHSHPSIIEVHNARGCHGLILNQV
jgi:hypothetical protein